MELQEICKEILNVAKKEQPRDLKSFNNIKMRVLHRFNYPSIPKNATIAAVATDEDRKVLKAVLSMKPVRTISGVAPIALMTDPYPCPHTIKGIGPCSYCPGGPGSPWGDVPQSYTGKEPSTKRSIRNNYDPYLGVMNRLEQYIAINAVPEKTDVILQGGTFNFFPKSYQDYFVKFVFKALNDFSRLFYVDGQVSLKRFNHFFELPTNLKEDGNRITNIHRKLLFVKNVDISDNELFKYVDDLFFNEENNFNSNYKTKKYDELSDKQAIDDAHDAIEKNAEFLPPETPNKDILDASTTAMKRTIKKVQAFDNPAITLDAQQKENETAAIRNVGLTFETKSDYGKLQHGNQMLTLGCTRVELGIQSIYNEVLEATNRGNSVEDNIESIRILKDLGFKINAHYMPGLPLTTEDMDRKGLHALFEDDNYKPDMLKLYPCLVMEGTALYTDFTSGKFHPLTTPKAAELIADVYSYVPEWVRIMRVQRDIPTYVTSGGVDKTNLRQYVDDVCKKKGIKSRDIRAREAGIYMRDHGELDVNKGEVVVRDYTASNGKEFFISFEDVKKDVLFGFVRMRYPSEFLRDEITPTSALIREIHVFSESVAIGEQSETSIQHLGVGKQCLEQAEAIAKKDGKDKMIVISAVGTREYFRKFGYELEGPYMVKKLS